MSAHEPRCTPTRHGQECEDCWHDSTPEEREREKHGTPASVAKVKQLLATLTDEERLEAISDFCKECGTTNLPCYCGPAFDE